MMIRLGCAFMQGTECLLPIIHRRNASGCALPTRSRLTIQEVDGLWMPRINFNAWVNRCSTGESLPWVAKSQSRLLLSLS